MRQRPGHRAALIRRWRPRSVANRSTRPRSPASQHRSARVGRSTSGWTSTSSRASQTLLKSDRSCSLSSFRESSAVLLTSFSSDSVRSGRSTSREPEQHEQMHARGPRRVPAAAVAVGRCDLRRPRTAASRPETEIADGLDPDPRRCAAAHSLRSRRQLASRGSLSRSPWLGSIFLLLLFLSSSLSSLIIYPLSLLLLFPSLFFFFIYYFLPHYLLYSLYLSLISLYFLLFLYNFEHVLYASHLSSARCCPTLHLLTLLSTIGRRCTSASNMEDARAASPVAAVSSWPPSPWSYSFSLSYYLLFLFLSEFFQYFLFSLLIYSFLYYFSLFYLFLLFTLHFYLLSITHFFSSLASSLAVSTAEVKVIRTGS